ncbi:hypothetical protein [Corynebacterium timonense]|uniref:Uncharacterized protein n=1 Tax=Corynebacterium timonense TaxID=441500 RepID=A0A1H1RE65_9CORY|nr:hypothetical protein [Corynebacterium timonense]SDS33836.1 hypothetical protein SAMN04488539_1473 [Corynebacterium timonense]
MQVFTFVVSEGAVVDAPAYARALRALGVSASELNRLRVRLSLVSGTRRAIIEVSGGYASLSLRPLSPSPEEITVTSSPLRDEREHPELFGPDCGWQRFALASLPTHEGVLVDASSRVPQAIAAPLLTIATDGTARVTVSGHPRTTPSIAMDGVLDILAWRGATITTAPEGFRVAELTESETWVVDSLYGARLVASWREYGTVRGGRTAVQRGDLPTHREVNELRGARASSF